MAMKDFSGRRPRMFILSRQPGAITPAKLPRALKESGWTVAAMYRPNSLLAATKHVDQGYECPATPAAILPRIVTCLRDWQPDFVVPGDIWSLQFLHGMLESKLVKALAPDIIPVLELSLGSKRSWSTLSDKHALLGETEAIAGVETPTTIPVRSGDEAVYIVETMGSGLQYPVVVKQGGNSGGAGVRICANEEQMVRAVRDLKRRDTPGWSIRSLWRTLNSIPFMTSYGDAGSLSVQEHISGTPFLHSFVAFKGRLVAGNTVSRALPYNGPTSPYCAYYPARIEGIESMARSIIGRTGFSGFGCFDFIVKEETGRPYLIECNPIPVNIAHLGGLIGVDLCYALKQCLQGCGDERTFRSSGDGADGTAVLFPYDLMRDPHSTAIDEHPEDVPYDDPGLLTAIERRFDIHLRRDRPARPSAAIKQS